MTISTVTWTLVDDLMVSYATPGTITQENYEAWLEDFSNKPFTKYLSTSTGTVNLTSLQRRGVGEVFKRRTLQVAVVTDERIVRGLVTAIGWMGANIKPFVWDDVDKALEFLAVSRPKVALAAIEKLRVGKMSSSWTSGKVT